MKFEIDAKQNPRNEIGISKGERDHRSGVDVADIGGDTGSSSDIVKSEPGNKRVKLHQQSQRLTDPASGTEHGNLAFRDGLRRVATPTHKATASGYSGLYGSHN